MVDGLADLLRVPLANPIYTLIAFVVLRLAYNKFQPGVWRIPGPTAAAYTKLWRVYDVYNGTAHLTAIELHRKHGALVRIGPNHVSVSDPDFISQFYSIREDYTKTGFYPIQSISWKKKPEMNLFSTRDPEEHRLSKRQIGAAYSLPNLLQSETAIDSCIDLFMSRLRELINTNSSVDLGAWLQYFAFDVVGEVTFATKLGFLEKGTDVDGMMAAIGGMLAYASLYGSCPRVSQVLAWKSNLFDAYACHGNMEPSPGLHLESHQLPCQHQARWRANRSRHGGSRYALALGLCQVFRSGQDEHSRYCRASLHQCLCRERHHSNNPSCDCIFPVSPP